MVEPTEGMTSIDVNSGRMVRESNPEDLALKTNLEAAREVMRQLRLRDLGGIIVIDFIDVKMEKHRREIETAVRDASKRDRAQMVILPLSQFCLMQIARQKTRPSLQVVSSDPCPACGGVSSARRAPISQICPSGSPIRRPRRRCREGRSGRADEGLCRSPFPFFRRAR